MGTNGMSEEEINELKERIQGMNKQEMEIVVSVLPIEVVQNRITAEILRLQSLERDILTMSSKIAERRP